jgi:hypothetical protein
MRRRPRVVPFARLPLRNLVRTLTDKPYIEWPQHLQLAYEILQNELKVAAPTARRLVIDSVSQAHACAQAVDRRARMTNEYKVRIKVRKSFSCLANCVRRAPARVRNSLDKRISSLIPPVVNTEVIDEILDAAGRIFARSEHEAAQTALRALSVRVVDGKQVVVLQADYSGLGHASRRHCESALSSLTRTSTSRNALAVFKVLASAIDTKPPDGIRAEVWDLIVAYVEAVTALWRQIGLRPSRATDSTDPKYRSKFHRFVELVLTAMTEPGSNRHNDNIDQIARRTWETHAQLPAEIRPRIGRGLRREDLEWLVSEDNVRKAIRLPAQKTSRDTP